MVVPQNKVGAKIKPNRGRGRPKGTPNKSTAAIKEMVIAALDKAGGIEYLAARAKDTPAAFMTLVGKVLPLQLTGDPTQPIVTANVSLEDVLAARARIIDEC
jgi:hypothetical protein